MRKLHGLVAAGALVALALPFLVHAEPWTPIICLPGTLDTANLGGLVSEQARATEPNLGQSISDAAQGDGYGTEVQANLDTCSTAPSGKPLGASD
jgi:hypothetical protein